MTSLQNTLATKLGATSMPTIPKPAEKRKSKKSSAARRSEVSGKGTNLDLDSTESGNKSARRRSKKRRKGQPIFTSFPVPLQDERLANDLQERSQLPEK